MSTVGTLIGNRSISPSLVRRTCPSCERQTSKLVPPMSTEIVFRWPARLARMTPPITPAAGPESTVRTGLSAADPAVVVPPFDCMMWTSEDRPSAEMPSSSRRRYLRMTGATYALMAVVLIRSYSLNSGSTSCESTTTESGIAALSAAPTIFSCAGLA